MVFTLDDVAGLEKQKKIVYDSLILPLKKKDLYSKLVLQPDKVHERNTFLLHGPPGTGKSFFAEALANSMNVPYYSFSGTEFLKSYVGEGAKSLRSAYSSSSGIIFIDELDAIGKNRSFLQSAPIDDILLELLVSMDGVNTNYNIVTIGATNRLDVIDPALLSRFSHIMNFPLPDDIQREEIIKTKSSYFNHKIDSFDFLVEKTTGFVGRQIENCFVDAYRNALSLDRSYLLEKDFEVNL